MNLLEKNLKSLALYDTAFVESLNDFFIQKTDREEPIVRWEKNLSGEMIPFICMDNMKEIRLCSAYSVENELQIWLEQYTKYIKKDSILYLFGLGNGFILDKLIPFLSEDGVLILYEPSIELFMQIMEQNDFSELFRFRNVYFVLDGVNTESIFDTMKMLDARMMFLPEQIVIMHMPLYRKLYPDVAEVFGRELIQWRVYQEQNRLTLEHWLKMTVEAPLQKLYFYKGAYVIERFRENWNPELPVIIVSAGPSLEKNMRELHKAKGHLLIVAVDMALQALQIEGIIPDIIVSLDAGVKMQYICNEKYRNVPLLCCTSTGEKLYLWNQGKKILFRERDFLQKIKEDSGLPRAEYGFYGSVSIAAFSIFAMLGSHIIIFAGQDLAYGEDGSSHAGGFEDGVIGNKALLPGYFGNDVESRSDWLGFWNWYKREIPKKKSTKVINATEGGASIPGTIQKRLKDVIGEWQDCFVPDDIWNRKESQITDTEYATMEHLIFECEREVKKLSNWNKSEYEANLNELKEMHIYPLLSEVMYVMSGECKWERFQMALSYLCEHGWEETRTNEHKK